MPRNPGARRRLKSRLRLRRKRRRSETGNSSDALETPPARGFSFGKRKLNVDKQSEAIPPQAAGSIESISAVTLATHDMAQAVRFYRALGFVMRYGGEGSAFTSFEAGSNYLNLIAESAAERWSWWGRVIFYVFDI